MPHSHPTLCFPGVILSNTQQRPPQAFLNKIDALTRQMIVREERWSIFPPHPVEERTRGTNKYRKTMCIVTGMGNINSIYCVLSTPFVIIGASLNIQLINPNRNINYRWAINGRIMKFK